MDGLWPESSTCSSASGQRSRSRSCSSPRPRPCASAQPGYALLRGRPSPDVAAGVRVPGPRIGRPTASRQASTAAPVVPWQPPHLLHSLPGSRGGPQRLGHGLGRRPGRGAHRPPRHILSPSNSFCIQILPRLLGLLPGPLTVHSQALSLSFIHLFLCLPFQVHVIFTPAIFCADNPAASFVNLVVPTVLPAL